MARPKRTGAPKARLSLKPSGAKPPAARPSRRIRAAAVAEGPGVHSAHRADPLAQSRRRGLPAAGVLGGGQDVLGSLRPRDAARALPGVG